MYHVCELRPSYVFTLTPIAFAGAIWDIIVSATNNCNLLTLHQNYKLYYFQAMGDNFIIPVFFSEFFGDHSSAY